MADIFQFSEQEIMSRCFVAGSNVVAVAQAGEGGEGVEEQEVWNRIFDATNNLLMMNR